jgi:hypothetical protein
MRSHLLAAAVLGLDCLAFLAAPAIATAAAPTLTAFAVPDHPMLVDSVAGFVLAMPALLAAPKGSLDKAKAWLKGLFKDKTDEEIATMAAELVEEQEGPPFPPAPTPAPSPTPNPAPDLSAQLQALLAPITAELATVKSALEAEATARKNAQEALQTQQAAERTKQIKTLLDEAVAKGKITPKQRTDTWEKRLTEGFDAFSPVLAELPDNPAVAKANAGGSTQKKDAGAPAAGLGPAAGTMAAGANPTALAYVNSALAGAQA